MVDDSVIYFFAIGHFTDKLPEYMQDVMASYSEMYKHMQKVTALFMTLSTLHLTSFDRRHSFRPETSTSFH